MRPQKPEMTGGLRRRWVGEAQFGYGGSWRGSSATNKVPDKIRRKIGTGIGEPAPVKISSGEQLPDAIDPGAKEPHKFERLGPLIALNRNGFTIRVLEAFLQLNSA
jgi:hypothetical protein